MTGNEYQNSIMNYPINYPDSLGPFCPILRMVEKTGKLSSTIVDILNKPDASITDNERIILNEQFGEILMYLTYAIYHSGLTLDSVMQYNIARHNNIQSVDSMMNRDIFSKH